MWLDMTCELTRSVRLLEVSVGEGSTVIKNSSLAFQSQEQEKEELLEQYRVLSGETERLVSESKASAGKVTNYHMELVQKQRSEMELSDKIRRLESEIQQVNQTEWV